MNESQLLALHDQQFAEQRMEPWSLGYHDQIQWWEKKKVKRLANRHFTAKMTPFRQRKFGKESLILVRYWRKRDANSDNFEEIISP